MSFLYSLFSFSRSNFYNCLRTVGKGFVGLAWVASGWHTGLAAVENLDQAEPSIKQAHLSQNEHHTNIHEKTPERSLVHRAAHGHARHVVLIVWDGLRPDFVTPEWTPTLYRLASQGMVFKNHHSIFPTSTEVNGTVLATGVWPQKSGVLANKEYRPSLNLHQSIDSAQPAVVKKSDELTGGEYLKVRTLAERMQWEGHQVAIAGTKWIALLMDRNPSQWHQGLQMSHTVFGGVILPAYLQKGLNQSQGPFPKKITFPNQAQDAWTTKTLTQYLWKDGVPPLSLLWLSDPDYSQHYGAPGSPVALAALRNSDEQLRHVLEALKAKGVDEVTDVIVVSDHGFSTATEYIKVDQVLAHVLSKEGFRAFSRFHHAPQAGDVLVVSQGGSVFFYVIDRVPAVVQRLVQFLQESPFAGVLLTRQPLPGTFSLAELHLESPSAPDVVMSVRWSKDKNRFGVLGTFPVKELLGHWQVPRSLFPFVSVWVDRFAPLQVDRLAPLRINRECGVHGSLSPFDIHNTLIAAGPDFRVHGVSTAPSSNLDVVPTLAWILGVTPSHHWDGRVLMEGFKAGRSQGGQEDQEGQGDQGSLSVKVEPSVYQRATCRTAKGEWTQELKMTRVGSEVYFDEGWGGYSAKEVKK